LSRPSAPMVNYDHAPLKVLNRPTSASVTDTASTSFNCRSGARGYLTTGGMLLAYADHRRSQIGSRHGGQVRIKHRILRVCPSLIAKTHHLESSSVVRDMHDHAPNDQLIARQNPLRGCVRQRPANRSNRRRITAPALCPPRAVVSAGRRASKN